MKSAGLDDLAVFVAVARAGGFRAASGSLGLSAGSVSEAVQRLESRLSARLIARTTRKMSLTEAGEALLTRAMPALSNLTTALNDVGEAGPSVSGTLRLTAPRGSSPFFLDDAVAAFCLAYPDVNVEIQYDDAKVDLVSSGVDAAIRSTHLLENGTHAVEIGPTLDMAVVASPDYLARCGRPKTPRDIVNHDGIAFSFDRSDRLAPWTFSSAKQPAYSVAPKPRLVVNDLLSLITFAKAGVGIAYTYRKPAEPAIASGELVCLFERSVPPLPRYTINYLSKRHMPTRLRAFIDFMKSDA